MEELPLDVQLLILHHVAPFALLTSCSRVCKTWSQEIGTRYFWKAVLRAQARRMGFHSSLGQHLDRMSISEVSWRKAVVIAS